MSDSRVACSAVPAIAAYTWIWGTCCWPKGCMCREFGVATIARQITALVEAKSSVFHAVLSWRKKMLTVSNEKFTKISLIIRMVVWWQMCGGGVEEGRGPKSMGKGCRSIISTIFFIERPLQLDLAWCVMMMLILSFFFFFFKKKKIN